MSVTSQVVVVSLLMDLQEAEVSDLELTSSSLEAVTKKGS